MSVTAEVSRTKEWSTLSTCRGLNNLQMIMFSKNWLYYLWKKTEPLLFLFQERYNWRRLTDRHKSENTWLERHYHGLSWKSKVFVRGQIRKEWLKRFKFNVIDIYELVYSLTEQSKKIVTICINHNSCYKTTCALHNVKLMRKYYFENICYS